MTIHTTAALLASSAGLSVFPPKEDGSKKPDTRRWVDYVHPDSEGQFVRLSDDEIRRTYANRRTGVGVFTGLPSGGVELFEFDDRATYERFLDVADEAGLGDVVHRIRAGYEETTPNEGIHWFYRCAEVAGNTKLATRPAPTPGNRHNVKTLIETRGNGGYAVTAPSSGGVHPTGRPYVQVSGGFDTIAAITPEERAALWQLARSFDEMPVREQRIPRQQPNQTAKESGERPGDDFNRRADWSDILADWTFVFEREGTRYLRRPGKQFGISATLNHTGRDTLIVFSTSTPFETAPTSYSKFAAYALLNHGNDYHAAASTLAAQGYGSKQAGVTFGGQTTDCDEWRRLADEQRRYIQLCARIRKNKPLKHLRNTIIALAGEAQTALEMGKTDAEGWFPVSLSDGLADAAGCSRKTAGVHLERLAEWGVLEKRTALMDHLDLATGELTPARRRTRIMVRLPSTPLDFLDTMSAFDPPERAPRPHRCCSHGRHAQETQARHMVEEAETVLNGEGSFYAQDGADPREEAIAKLEALISTIKGGKIFPLRSKRSKGWGQVPAGSPPGSEACALCGNLTVGHVLCATCDPGGWSATGPRVTFGGMAVQR